MANDNAGPSSARPATTANEENVFLFVPNLIGYARILFLGMACWYMRTDVTLTCVYYFASAALDAVDGYAARVLGQSSRLGAMLDSVTDRMGTLALSMGLCALYSEYTLLWQLLALLDIASHWVHMHSHVLSGTRGHKTVDTSTNPVLALYYSSRAFLFFMCAGNELFFLSTYVTYFTHGPRVPLLGVGTFKLLVLLSAPVMAVKTAISLVHLGVGAQRIVDIDDEERRATKRD